MYWSVVSPFRPFGPTLALVFVLLVGALKAIAEDKRRHVEDNKLNNSTAHVLHADGGSNQLLVPVRRACSCASTGRTDS